jgi:glycosyltransferase involved in cell wall biosynthesis
VPQAPRVTIVTSRLDLGGTERHLTRIVPELRRRGIDITVYLLDRGGALEAELLTKGVPIEGSARSFLHWPRATLQLARFLRRERPDIVHFFLPRPYIYGSLAAALAGHRRRIMSRRSLANYMLRHPSARTVERVLHRRCTALIGNSQAVVAQLAAECGDAHKVGLLYNGVVVPTPAGAQERQRIRQSLQLPNDAIAIVIVANLITYKGHRDLIEALALIKKTLPEPWSLLVIGRDTGIGAELRDRAKSLGLANNISWLGEQVAIDEFLRASDIFVLPSHEEGFSNALLEAMANGVSVIATAVGGNRDAVVDEESGLLVPSKDSHALGAAISRLAKDSILRARLGEAGRQRVRDHFSLEACIRRYETLYREVCKQQPESIKDILPELITPSAPAKLPASTRPK